MIARWLPVFALGVLVAVTAAVVAVVTVRATPPSDAQRALALAAELRCPDCQGLSVADSPTSAAREIRRQIGELIAAGASDEEVRAHFVARYGEWIRLAPSSLLLWVVPFAVVLGGALGLVAWLTSRRGDAEPPAAPANPAVVRAVREEAEALDA